MTECSTQSVLRTEAVCTITQSMCVCVWYQLDVIWLDWIGLYSVLHPRQHSIGYMGDGFTGQKSQPTVSKY